MKKGTKLYSMLAQKCPRCHEDDLYEYGPLNIRHLTKMKEKCGHCGLKYTREPGFYDGAMYVSYAMQVAIFATVFVGWKILHAIGWLPEVTPNGLLIAIPTVAILLMPMTFRLSRSIYINFFERYEGGE